LDEGARVCCAVRGRELVCVAAVCPGNSSDEFRFPPLQSTDLFEGTIIRAMRRLSELLAQLAVAAGVVGNTELAEKATKGVEGLQRGIVFAASLYLSE
jgi:hypothetical protein